MPVAPAQTASAWPRARNCAGVLSSATGLDELPDQAVDLHVGDGVAVGPPPPAVQHVDSSSQVGDVFVGTAEPGGDAVPVKSVPCLLDLCLGPW